MKRCWKKAVAFGIALSMLASCGVVVAEETETNATGITVIEEAVYDEAVSFSNSVVLVENGHWQDCIKDETTGEEVSVTDVTEDTNIVFIDGAGNRKVIKNKDDNGDKLFDSVGLAYSRWDYYSCEYIYVFRGTDRAYISAEGEIFGESLEFYKDIKYINDDYLFVSKDGKTYELINKAGDVLYNVVACDSVYFINGYFYIKADESVVIIKENGMEVVKEYHNVNNFYLLNDNNIYISTEEKIIVLNSNAEEVLKDYVIEYCNAVEYSSSYLVFRVKSEGGTEYFLMNMDSGNVVMQSKSELKVYSDGFVLDSDGGIFTNIEGTVNVDLNPYTNQILENGDGNYAGQVNYYYDNGVLYHSLHRAEEDSSITYIISTKDGYQTTELVKAKGLITAIDKEKERYILRSSSGKIYGLYNLSGELIKDFGDYSGNSYETRGHLFEFSENILTNAYIKVNGISNNAFIKTDGSIVGQYETVKDHGGFIFGGTSDGRLEVLNSNGEIVFSEAGLYEPKASNSSNLMIKSIKNAYGLENPDYFTVIRNGVCNLYDYNGNKIEIGNNYSAIGPCGMISGLCKVGENDYIGYEYENYVTDSGLCVTRKTDAEGNHKYGVIKFNTVLEKGDCNGDKVINAQDALAVLKHAAKLSHLPDETAADVNGDEAVNAEDALEILKYAADIIDEFGKEDIVIPTCIPDSEPTAKPATPISYDSETDTYTMHGIGEAYSEGQKVPNGYYILENPFAGMDLNEDFVLDENNRPVWNKGVTLSFWVKVPTTEIDINKDAVVMTFSLPEHIVVSEGALRWYYFCKDYNADDENYSMGTTETYVSINEDGTETEYTVMSGYGEKVRFNPNYPTEGYYKLTDEGGIDVVKKGADIEVEESWVRIKPIGSGLYEKYSKRFYEKGGENSEIKEVKTTARLNIFASGSIDFLEDDCSGYQLNPNAEDYLKSHGNTNNNKYGMMVNNNPANGFSLNNNPTPDTVTNYDEWRFMVVVIANDCIQVYSNGVRITEEYYCYKGSPIVDAYKIADNSFNKGYGPSFCWIHWNDDREDLDGITLMELISDENTILEIGGQTSSVKNTLVIGTEIINGPELIGTPEGVQVKDVKFYDCVVSEENIKADGIIGVDNL